MATRLEKENGRKVMRRKSIKFWILENCRWEKCYLIMFIVTRKAKESLLYKPLPGFVGCYNPTREGKINRRKKMLYVWWLC